jgi:hypothetical protein
MVYNSSGPRFDDGVWVILVAFWPVATPVDVHVA